MTAPNRAEAPDRVEKDKAFLKRALEATIRIGLVVLLLAWCFEIIRPFVIPVFWGMIIAVATYPGYRWLETRLGGRNVIAAVIMTVLGLVLLIGPMVLLGGTLVNSAQGLAADLSDGTLTIPPPPGRVTHWPIIGESLYGFWALASTNLEEALGQLGPYLKTVGSWLVTMAAGASLGILEFIFAIVIAGVLLAHARGGSIAADAIASRLVGERGPEFADVAQATVRSVARGILGVALIQSILAGLGFLAVGLPAAGLLALICLLLAVVQIGVFPVLIPVVIHVFATSDTVTAVIFAIWCVIVGLTDNALKPFLLGRGAAVPMVVIFVGAIGGFLASGIIGLFVGAVVLSLGYTLFLAWLNGERQSVPDETAPGGPS
jgi:predicted PurR-regulated permease PerM